MRLRKFKWLLLITVPVGIAFFLFAFSGEIQPTYNGEPLSDWLWHYQLAQNNLTQKRQAESAVRAIGQEAVPHLIQWIAYRPTHGWMWLNRIVNSLIQIFDRSRSFGDSMLKNQFVAANGFKILGAEAASAVPELQKILRAGDETTAGLAAESLVYIGSPSAPSLEDILTDPELAVREAGTNAMSAMADKAAGRVMP